VAPHFLCVVAVSLALLTAPRVVLADPNNSGTVNCGDPNTKDACLECCSTLTCIGKITCCPLIGTCTIVNKAVRGTSFPPLKLNVTVGGLKLQFQRTGNDTETNVKLKASFLPGVFPKGLSFKARLTGTDARLGGLLYPVTFLEIGGGALNMLHTHGYDVTVDEASLPTCQAMFPAQACVDLANALSKSIDSALGMGIRAEVSAFEAGTQALGLASCPGIVCPTGETDCSGTCVNLATDNNNCGSCGSVCLQSCIGGVCTIP
jgi:hypothetical protein